MTTEVKCPKCNDLMDEGFLLDRGDMNVVFQPMWIEGKVEKSIWTGIKTTDRRKKEVITFRCPKCGFLEFYAPE